MSILDQSFGSPQQFFELGNAPNADQPPQWFPPPSNLLDSPAAAPPVTPAPPAPNTATPKKRPKAPETRQLNYASLYPTLSKLWESDGTNEAQVRDYLGRLKRQEQLWAILEKIGECHSEEKVNQCVNIIVDKWKSRTSLPGPDDEPTPKKRHKHNPLNAADHATQFSTSAACTISSQLHDSRFVGGSSPLRLVNPSNGSTPQTLVYTSAAGVSGTPSCAAVRRSLLPILDARPADVVQRSSAFGRDNPSVGCWDPLELLEDTRDVLLEIGDQTISLHVIIRQMMGLHEDQPSTDALAEFPVLAEEVALQLQEKLAILVLPAHLEPLLKSVASSLLLVCRGIIQQDHLRRFPEALNLFKQAYECIKGLGSCTTGFQNPILDAPMYQALFSRILARLGSSYRVNKCYPEELHYANLAYEHMNNHFKASGRFGSLRASIAGLLCAAHRWNRQHPNSLELAEKYANEAVLLYEFLPAKPGGLQWATSELIKVYYASGYPEKANRLLKGQLRQHEGEGELCSTLRGYRLQYEGLKELYQQAYRATRSYPISFTTPTPFASPLKLLFQAQSVLGKALALAQDHHESICRCAAQAIALRKCIEWTERELSVVLPSSTEARALSVPSLAIPK